MKFYSGVLLAFALSLLLGAVSADEHDAPYRLAVVNMSDILKRAPQSAAESEQLEERFASRERALAVRQDELLRADEAFNRERAQLPTEQRVTRESELRAIQRALRREREDLREEVRLSKDRALNRLQRKVAEAIETIRQREAIDIIFRESDYIVASARVDITTKVLAELQRQFEAEQDNALISEEGGALELNTERVQSDAAPENSSTAVEE